MDQKKNPFAPPAADDRAARACINDLCKSINLFRVTHAEALKTDDAELKYHANRYRANLKAAVAAVKAFSPEQPLEKKTSDRMAGLLSEGEKSLMILNTFADESGNAPDDPELDEFIEKMTSVSSTGDTVRAASGDSPGGYTRLASGSAHSVASSTSSR